MYFDRFDIVEAYHLWFSHYYNGMFHPNYIRRGRIEENLRFKPSAFHSYESLTDNGQYIYDQLKQKQFVSRSYDYD